MFMNEHALSLSRPHPYPHPALEQEKRKQTSAPPQDVHLHQPLVLPGSTLLTSACVRRCFAPQRSKVNDPCVTISQAGPGRYGIWAAPCISPNRNTWGRTLGLEHRAMSDAKVLVQQLRQHMSVSINFKLLSWALYTSKSLAKQNFLSSTLIAF